MISRGSIAGRIKEKEKTFTWEKARSFVEGQSGRSLSSWKVQGQCHVQPGINEIQMSEGGL
jgi:hypothetical protein